MENPPAITVRRSRRAKYMRLTVHPGGTVVLTAPENCSTRIIEKFVLSRRGWLGHAIERMRRFKSLPGGRKEYLARRDSVRALILERLAYWNDRYGFTYHRVSIKDTRSLWGSCSRAGNLNFSYKLAYLPQELQDYILVHELCHLRERNHSRAFWTLVAKTIPNHRALRKELQQYVLS